MNEEKTEYMVMVRRDSLNLKIGRYEFSRAKQFKYQWVQYQQKKIRPTKDKEITSIILSRNKCYYGLIKCYSYDLGQ